MKIHTNFGNLVLVLDRPAYSKHGSILLGLKRANNESDKNRKRKRIGCGKWTAPGGAAEHDDKKFVHGAQRELFQETGIYAPLTHFQLRGKLYGYLEKSNVPLWLVRIYVLVLNERPKELRANYEYLKMEWFPFSSLPVDLMIPSDVYWMPRILNGERLRIRIYSDAGVTEVKKVIVSPYPH